MENTAPFTKIADPTILLPLLEKRLPASCLMYNTVKMHSRFLEQGSIYTLNGEIDETSWIVATHYREVLTDDGQGYHISADKNLSKLSKQEAIQILSTCPLFNWDEPFFFAAIEPWISEIVQEISIRHKGHFTVTIPCHMYYMEKESCLSLDIKSPDPEHVEIKPLDSEQGLQFLLGNDEIYTEAKEMNTKGKIVWGRFIRENESAGVYVDGSPVCGLVTRSFGILGSLSTKKEHQRKGYASLAMQFAFKALAKNGLIPVTTVVPRNNPSIKLHEALGCKHGGMVDYVEVWESLVNRT